MSIFTNLNSKKSRPSESKTTYRPSVLVTLKLEDKYGLPMDPGSAWFLIQEAFKNHPSLLVTQAEIGPDSVIANNQKAEK